MFTAKDRENLVWFWHTYMKAKSPWLLVVMLMIFAQGLVYQQFLALTENGLRVVFERGDMADLMRTCATVFGVFAFRGLMSYFVPRLSAWISEDAVCRLRSDLVSHLTALDLAFFEKTRVGTIILRLANQADRLADFVGQTTVKAIRDAITIIILSVYLGWKQPFLFLMAAAFLPIIILIMQHVSQKVKAIQAEAEGAMAIYINGIEEMSNGMRTVKILGQEDAERDRLTEATVSLRDLRIRIQTARATVMPYIDLAAACVFSLVIGGGGYMVLSDDFDIDGAGIIAFMIGLVLIFDPGRRLAGFTVGLQMTFMVLGMIRSLFETRASVVDAPDATDVFDASADITFQDVSFKYPQTKGLFKDLNLTFTGGQVTAIVGPTGSGKTTVLSLIARLYDPKKGAIMMGDVPINKIKVKSLRSAFSVVAQDIVVFNNSIFENIRYVRPDATEDEIWAAAEAAEIADLMRERGDKEVGPKGAALSGGQKQRIAIARAFLRDAPVVLLDEATSALDQKTEDRIKAALNRLSEGRTTIVVAHRLSSIADANNIYVLEGGRVAEEGKHETLIAQGGLYAGLYEAQRDSYRD